MSYLVKLRRSAEKELDSLPGKLHNRIVSALSALKENPLPIVVKKLQGREGYRIRIGGYRVFYVIDKSKKVVDVFSIADRKEVYRL
jgi:mRNA interferase RelE/StbE